MAPQKLPFALGKVTIELHSKLWMFSTTLDYHLGHTVSVLLSGYIFPNALTSLASRS